MSTAILEAPSNSDLTFGPLTNDGEIYCPKGFEYVDGQLRELNVSFLSTYIAGQLFSELNVLVKKLKLGWASPEGTSYRCFPDAPRKVRRADGAFHLLNRLSMEQATTEGHCTVVPDIVIEVVSPNDSANEVNAKKLEWLQAGVKLVWIVFPYQKEVHVRRADGTLADLAGNATLTGESILPDFKLPLVDLFRLPIEER